MNRNETAVYHRVFFCLGPKERKYSNIILLTLKNPKCTKRSLGWIAGHTTYQKQHVLLLKRQKSSCNASFLQSSHACLVHNLACWEGIAPLRGPLIMVGILSVLRKSYMQEVQLNLKRHLQSSRSVCTLLNQFNVCWTLWYFYFNILALFKYTMKIDNFFQIKTFCGIFLVASRSRRLLFLLCSSFFLLSGDVFFKFKNCVISLVQKFPVLFCMTVSDR